jgi:hypothetical protein
MLTNILEFFLLVLPKIECTFGWFPREEEKILSYKTMCMSEFPVGL